MQICKVLNCIKLGNKINKIKVSILFIINLHMATIFKKQRVFNAKLKQAFDYNHINIKNGKNLCHHARKLVMIFWV